MTWKEIKTELDKLIQDDERVGYIDIDYLDEKPPEFEIHRDSRTGTVYISANTGWA